MYDLGLRIKEIRKKRGISQRELARRINKSYSVVCGYESNAQQPPLDVAISIASVLNISLDYLVGFCEDDTYSLKGLDGQQREVVDLLFKELSCPTTNEEDLSSDQVRIIQKLMLCFSTHTKSL